MESTRQNITARQGRWRDAGWWQASVCAAAIGAAVLAVAVTLPADFLRYPGWLAAQKADFVIGPALVGVYWLRRRPQSPFGPMLIAWGFVGALYIFQSSTNSWLFTIGLFWEKVFGLATYVLILAFPTGRLDRPAKILVTCGVVTVLALAVTIQLLQPQVGAGGSISSCRSLCPQNELAVTSDPSLAQDVFKAFSYTVLGLALAVAVLLAYRFLKGTPPQRRALAIGLPVAFLFLLCEMTFQLLNIFDAQDTRLYGIVIWVFVAARAAVWYGFLFALIAAELFAARALRRLVEQSLSHPSRQELQQMLRQPLGDPQLQLLFLDEGTESGAHVKANEPATGIAVTTVARDGSPRVAILHDAQLNDDPELLTAAGAVALLAAENADLDAGWNAALADLNESRRRLVRAADDARREVERNLHDSVQQHLIAIMMKLGRADDGTLSQTVRESLDDLEAVVDDVREVGRGLYPAVLTDHGIIPALNAVRQRTSVPLDLQADGVGRYSPEVESAIYYCCVEAIQNATKHGGAENQITVTVRDEGDLVRFDVSDDGAGFEPGSAAGTGLQNMEDRVGALGGRLSVTAAPGAGATITGRVPTSPPAG